MPHNDLYGKTALVTGAGKRIGRAISLALGEQGVNIVAHYGTSGAEVGSLRTELEKLGVNTWALQANFSRAEEAQALIARALEAADALDILINSASIFDPSTLNDMDIAGILEHMQVNAWAPYLLCREFAKLAGAGQIINLLDSRITDTDRAHVAYILSKKTLADLTRMMALEFAPKIAVNGIAPGLILPPPGKDEAYLRRLADTVPLKRHGGPKDITAAVLYLLNSDFVTGQVLYVDGGRHLKEYEHGPHSDT